MTLVMTLVSRKLIMQCADFRATDTKTGKYQDRTQKQVIIVRQGWSAVVSFTGVAEANYKRTDKWLREAVEGLDRSATFNDLLARLKQAERWLARVPAEHRHHSFIAAGFIGLQPILGLVSNFERLDATPLSDAALTLGIQILRPG